MLADARDQSKLWLGGGGGGCSPPPYSRSEFLSLNTIDLLGQIILFCVKGCSAAPLGLCPLGAGSVPLSSYDNQEGLSRHYHKPPRGVRIAPSENPCLSYGTDHRYISLELSG